MPVCAGIELQALPTGVAAQEPEVRAIDEAGIIAGLRVDGVTPSIVEDIEGGTGGCRSWMESIFLEIGDRVGRRRGFTDMIEIVYVIPQAYIKIGCNRF